MHYDKNGQQWIFEDGNPVETKPYLIPVRVLWLTMPSVAMGLCGLAALIGRR